LDTFVTGLVNQELLLRNEYLLAEDRILPAHLPSRLRLTDPERRTLAEIDKQPPMSILLYVMRKPAAERRAIKPGVCVRRSR
jgi:hypothetical protein